MTFVGLLLRNLVYHRRGNVAVFLGVALGTAVLTGALLVGDSLRGSLRSRALDQLGWVEQALFPGRFFRAGLADELPAKIAPVLLLQGSAKSVEHRAGKVSVLGVDGRFWRTEQVPISSAFWESDEAQVVLNAQLARKLGIENAGEDIVLSIPKSDALPRESLLGKRKREDVLLAVTVKVSLILPDEGMARFSLKPSPEPVSNAFVPLRFLQSKLGIPGRANGLLIGAAGSDLDGALARKLTLDDWNLKLRTPEDRARAFVRYLDPRNLDGEKLKKVRWNGRVPDELAKAADASGIISAEQVIAHYRVSRDYLSVESRQLYLDPSVVAAVEKVAKKHVALKAVPTLVYLADGISDGKHELPYAVVAGIEPTQLHFADDNDRRPLKNNEIALAAWPKSSLNPQRGGMISLSYYAPDERNELQLQHEAFVFRGRIALEGIFDDPDWTPEFPGITDKLDIGSWENPPFPFSAKRVTPGDDNYWKRYRTTPKAYVTLETAQKMWKSRFGNLTSFHVSLGPGMAAPEFSRLLLLELKPQQGGFVFQSVKELGLRAGAGSTDFSVLFLAFSFFLIVSALLLVGLLFRLNLERRSPEVGLLMATGWSHGRVRRLLMGEGVLLALGGGMMGLAGALFYAEQMLALLRRNWPGGENLTFLRLHAETLSFIIGYVASLAVSFLTIVWALRVLAKVSPRALLAGETTSVVVAASPGRRWSSWIMVFAGLGAIGSLAAGLFVEGHEAKAGSFFGSGALLLMVGLAALWAWLKRRADQQAPQRSLAALGVRNAGRHPVRSILTVGLLSAATFLITAVESFHKETGADFHLTSGGSGGFPLLAESDVAVFQDLNQPAVRAELQLPTTLADVQFFPFRARAGDDASCLNLYQPLKPRLLAVPPRFVQRGGFQFSAGLWTNDAEKANPWLLLGKATGETDTFPAIVDANSAQWILKVPLGGTIAIVNDKGERKKLKVVALLRESIFQSDVLLGEADFLALYPRQEGFHFFLIDGPVEKTALIQSALETDLGEHGFNVMPTADRLRAYFAVENTYLATFQALGGLGLVLGALGLAIVLLRGVWERRAELALLRALGFAKPRLAWLVLAENLFLLLAGLAAGTVAALLAVAPHLGGAGSQVLWVRLVVQLTVVVTVGLAAGLAAIVGTLRTPLLMALRCE